MPGRRWNSAVRRSRDRGVPAKLAGCRKMDVGGVSGTLHPAPDPLTDVCDLHLFPVVTGKVPAALRVTAALGAPPHTIFRQTATTASPASFRRASKPSS